MLHLAPDNRSESGGLSVRWQIAILVSIAIAISYLDHQTLPVPVQSISRDIPLNNSPFSARNRLLPGTGVSPEWLYKGNGHLLRAHREPLDIPWFAEDGGEEAEIAGAYVIAPNGQPYRVGLAVRNEFSDHQLEKKNYGRPLRNSVRVDKRVPALMSVIPLR